MGSFEQITQEMIVALGDEITAIKEKGAGRDVLLVNGHLVGRTAGRYLYTFSLQTELNVPADTPGQLHVGSVRMDATIVGVQEFEVILGVSEDLGERVPAAKLTCASYYLLEMLCTRLQESIAGKLQANRDLVVKALSHDAAVNASAPLCSTARRGGEDDRDPNMDQVRAVELCTTKDVAFIWGPPGTGKTRTVGLLVERSLAKKRSVLVTSHTNIAVDRAVLEVKKALPAEAVDQGVLIRYGPTLSSDVEDVTFEKVVERKARSLVIERESIERELERVRETSTRLASMHSAVSRVTACGRVLDKCSVEIASRKDSAAANDRQRNGVLSLQHELRERLKEAEAAGFLKRLFTGLSPEAVCKDLDRAATRLRELESQRSQAEKTISDATARLVGAQEALAQARSALERYGNIPSDLDLRVDRVEREIRDLESRRSAVDAAIKGIEQSALSEAQVVGTTLSRLAISEGLFHRKYDTVIVDEASMVPLPSLWFAGCLATRGITVSGDFRQLAPIAIGDTESIKKWLRKDIFEAAGVIDSRGTLNPRESRMVPLNRQYRMHPVIGELANTLAYRAHPLIHCAEQCRLRDGLLARPEPGSPVVLCDTSEANPWCAQIPGGYSRYNIYSALLCARLADQALESGAKTVGIITPYRVQARLIEGLVKEMNPRTGDTKNLQVATIHRFQGNERDVIILDLVDGPPFPLGVLLKDDSGADSLRLINVASTRAKGKLVVVCHLSHLSSKASPRSVLRAFLDYASNKGRYLDGRQIVESYADGGVNSVRAKVSSMASTLPDPNETKVYNESTFWPTYLDDLSKARERVVIFSPFIQPRRMAEMMQVLRTLTDRGIAVTVMARKTSMDDERLGQLVKQVKESGVQLIERKDLHEKLSFVDQRIAWVGSLNILSHSRSTEVMLRFSSPGAVSKILEQTGTLSLIQAEGKRRDQAARFADIQELVLRCMSLPTCPMCGRTMELRSGPYGPFFGCPFYWKGCKGKTVDVPRGTLSAVIDEMAMDCPDCEGGRVVLKSGKRGPFLSCSNWPECKWSASV